MTVVSAFAVQNQPILFGDLLISQEHNENTRQATLPALGDVTDFFGGCGWQISGLAQKIVLIGPNCALGWAGSWLGARIVVDHLRRLAEKGPLTQETIRAYLMSETELDRHDASFVGWTHEGNYMRKFWFNAEIFDGGVLGEVAAAGTGVFAVKQYATGRQQTSASGTTGPIHAAVFHGISMASLLLRAELHGGDSAPTLRNLFGGGYEIAFFANGRFQKFGGATFLFWEAKLEGDLLSMSLPQLMVKQQYADDALLLRTGRIRVNQTNGSAELFDEQFHAVLPMYKLESLPSVRAGDVQFTSHLFVHCFAVRLETGGGFHILMQGYSKESEPELKFNIDEGHLHFGFKDSFIRRINESFRAKFPS